MTEHRPGYHIGQAIGKPVGWLAVRIFPRRVVDRIALWYIKKHPELDARLRLELSDEAYDAFMERFRDPC